MRGLSAQRGVARRGSYTWELKGRRLALNTAPKDRRFQERELDPDKRGKICSRAVLEHSALSVCGRVPEPMPTMT